MYPSLSNATENNTYDFESDENEPKWRGLFFNALKKVQRQVHPSLCAKEDGLEYIKKLILQLLQMLCSSQPHGVQDVEERVQKTFPHPIDKWAIRDAQSALDKGKKKSTLVLPVDKIHPLLVREVLGYKVDYQVTIYIVAVLEYIAADILKLTGNYVKNIKHQEITLQDIQVAMYADKVLMDMFFQDDDDALTVDEELVYVRRGSLTYEEIVKDLVLEEKQFMRDLNMIIKVFRAPFVRLFSKSKDLEVIFSNILDVHELTANLLSSLEDTLEVTEENAVPFVGGCFEDLAEGAEFDVYEKYAEDILKPNCRDRLNTLIQRHDATETLLSVGHLFKEAVKYVLPKLQLGPIYHCLHFFDVIKALIETGSNHEDRDCLEQALGVFTTLKTEIERKLTTASMMKRKPGGTTLRFQGRAERAAAINKMNELQKTIDGWEGKNIKQSCNEFIMEGPLFRFAGKRKVERYVFLFNGLIIFTKQNTKKGSVSGPVGDYKLKEKFNIRKLDVVDREDTDEIKNFFEIQVRDHPSLTVEAKTLEDKCNWMAALVSLLTRSMIERMLDVKLMKEEKPLKLPSPELYRFGEEDCENENIVFEEITDQTSENRQIKGGTLLKLVERLTYHKCADPKFVRTFLTTYRTFCKPEDLLKLLIERFQIPEPQFNSCAEDLNDTMTVREELRRFRTEFSKPVQFRVLNVLRHWVEHHWYDFTTNENLLNELNSFRDSVKGKAMRKCVESINKVIYRKLESDGVEKQKTITHLSDPPIIEWHIARKSEDFDLMTLHPIEIARQVTLLEFELYCAVKPSEMVGSVWVKKDRNVTSFNLLRMIKHSTRFTFWLEKCIIETGNFEERVAILSRIVEIMMVFQELNNFNAVVEVVSALNSAPVHRLEHTFEELDQKNHKLMKAFEEACELNADHFKKYIEKLRSINPPCVPFMGMYLTNILLTEEGNPDYLKNTGKNIINFNKQRKVAEIIGEIQQYQNQPYCLQTNQEIKNFFLNLDPMGDMQEKDFNDYLYTKSLELEPRNCKQPTKYERRREYSLKSPGIKPTATRHHSTSNLKVDKSHSLSIAPNSSSSIQRLHDETDLDLLASRGATPPTPSTPLTPPHDRSGDNSVFAHVMLPETNSLMSVATWSISNPVTMLPHPRDDIPPPLPPRRNKRESVELSPVRQEPPQLPPRPPPLPPRRSELLLQNRWNGDRSGSVTPVLPPKTYKATHHRKQSS